MLYGGGMTGPWEANFRASMKSIRERSETSQTDVARAMKERGHGFHQQTVDRIEKGTRPVRLDEAYAIAEILGSDLSLMTVAPGRAALHSISERLAETERSILQSLADFAELRIQMALRLDTTDDEDLPPAWEEIYGSWVERTPIDLVGAHLRAEAASDAAEAIRSGSQEADESDGWVGVLDRTNAKLRATFAAIGYPAEDPAATIESADADVAGHLEG